MHHLSSFYKCFSFVNAASWALLSLSLANSQAFAIHNVHVFLRVDVTRAVMPCRKAHEYQNLNYYNNYLIDTHSHRTFIFLYLRQRVSLLHPKLYQFLPQSAQCNRSNLEWFSRILC